MTIVAVDPGYRQSAVVVYDGARVMHHMILPNLELLSMVGDYSWPSKLPVGAQQPLLVIEQMQLFTSNYGVGQEIFDSVFWSGRFVQAWEPRRWDRILRSKVRGHLHASKGGDAAVRAALIARFGPFKEDAIGRKSKPGPLYGIKADEWSALAIAVTWADQHANEPNGDVLRPGTVAQF